MPGAPLIAQNRVLGCLYGDMAVRYGSFTQADADMLGMLASQGAVALENVRPVERLEEQVAEWTAELREANKEAEKARQAAEQANQVESIFLADLPLVYSDADKIKRILLNLLSNAAKFTHEGTISVTCNLHPVTATGPQGNAFTIAVSDTGIGMNEEQAGRVFEEFQQAETTTARTYGGTGLGLPISKRLAQLLGGDLTASSAAG